MLRRRCALHYEHLLLSDSETESDNPPEYYNTQTRKINEKGKIIAAKCHKSRRTKKKIGIRGEESSRDAKSLKEDPETVIKLAKEYQQKMKQIPIPKTRRSTKDIVFITWHALTSSMKQAYGQPLHYLTRVLAKQWDRSRNGTDDNEEKPMDDIIPPAKAESIIWDVEEIHRLCTSYSYLAKLWVSDPDYHAFIDEALVIPTS